MAKLTLEILGCDGSACRGHKTTSVLVGDNLVIDAGTGVFRLLPSQLVECDNLLITHAHLDHTVALPFMADIIAGRKTLNVYGLPETNSTIRNSLLNGEVFPSMHFLKAGGKKIVQFHDIKPYERYKIGGVDLTVLPVEHLVPTVAFCIHGSKSDFMFISDIYDAPEPVWEFIRENKRITQMSIETCFPNAMEQFGDRLETSDAEIAAPVVAQTPAEAEDQIVYLPYQSAVSSYHHAATAHIIRRAGYRDTVKQSGARNSLVSIAILW